MPSCPVRPVPPTDVATPLFQLKPYAYDTPTFAQIDWKMYPLVTRARSAPAVPPPPGRGPSPRYSMTASADFIPAPLRYHPHARNSILLRCGGGLRFSCSTTIWLSSYIHSCPNAFGDESFVACAKYKTTSLPSLMQGLDAWRPSAEHGTNLPDRSCNWKLRIERPFCVARSSSHSPMMPATLTTKGAASCSLFISLVNSASNGGTSCISVTVVCVPAPS